MYNGVTLLCSRDWHNTVNQSTILQLKKKYSVMTYIGKEPQEEWIYVMYN